MFSVCCSGSKQQQSRAAHLFVAYAALNCPILLALGSAGRQLGTARCMLLRCSLVEGMQCVLLAALIAAEQAAVVQAGRQSNKRPLLAERSQEHESEAFIGS
jgi:hypothetical protein